MIARLNVNGFPGAVSSCWAPMTWPSSWVRKYASGMVREVHGTIVNALNSRAAGWETIED